jgi:hypothetical protein
MGWLGARSMSSAVTIILLDGLAVAGSALDPLCEAQAETRRITQGAKRGRWAMPVMSPSRWEK